MNRFTHMSAALWMALVAAQGAPLNEPVSGYAWAPDGKRIAYCGTRFSSELKLWLIDVATGERKQAPGSSLAGPGSCSPVWHPSKNVLLASRPHEIRLLNIATGTVRTIALRGESGAPRFSPDGNWISYVVGGKLLIHSLLKGTTRVVASSDAHTLRAEPDWLYRHRIFMDTAYWWAPDSSAIAYLETARIPKLFPTAGDPLPHVAIRIVDIASPRSRTVDLPAAEAYLGQIVWTPDSRGLAIQSLDRRQTSLEVLLADAVTGKTTPILKEADLYWINLDPRGIQFLPDGNRFLWTSERTGFRHIFLYDLAGRRLLSQITNGDWEVSTINAVDEHSVTFTATLQSPLERQVYAISLDGPSLPVRLTVERGWHNALTSSDGKALIDFSSSLTRLPSIRLIGTGEKEITVSSGDGDLLPVELATVRVHDGLTLNAMLIRPPGFQASMQYPAVVLAPSGPRTQTVRNASDTDEFLWAQSMARKGYVVFAVDGRGSGGRGHRFEEPIHYRLGGMELPDQLDGLSFLRNQGFVDMERIGVFGSSYAGMIVLGAMMHSHGIYRAGLANSPITDWTLVDAFTAERYLGPLFRGTIAYAESSPNEFAKGLRGPMLVTVDPDQTGAIDQVNVLRGELIERDMLRPNRAAIESKPREALFERATRFFVETLGPPPASGPVRH